MKLLEHVKEMEKKIPTSKDMEQIVSRRQLTVLFLAASRHE